MNKYLSDQRSNFKEIFCAQIIMVSSLFMKSWHYDKWLSDSIYSLYFRCIFGYIFFSGFLIDLFLAIIIDDMIIIIIDYFSLVCLFFYLNQELYQILFDMLLNLGDAFIPWSPSHENHAKNIFGKIINSR